MPEKSGDVVASGRELRETVIGDLSEKRCCQSDLSCFSLLSPDLAKSPNPPASSSASVPGSGTTMKRCPYTEQEQRKSASGLQPSRR